MRKGETSANPGVDASRLAAIAGKAAALPANDVQAQPGIKEKKAVRPISLEPDLSRIRKCAIDETPAQRKKRLAAKTINYSATILARIAILCAVGFYAWHEYQTSYSIHRGVLAGMFVMVADFGRVILKAMDPGSK